MPDAAALYDVNALRTIETRAAQRLGGECPDGTAELMRRAGQAAWREALRLWPSAQRIVVACGPGHNGGDGYVLARHAHQSGRQVSALQLGAPRGELARRVHSEYEALGGRCIAFDGDLPEAELIVDGLFGIGLSRAPDHDTARLIEAINRQSAPVLALDVPSGVDARTGATPGVAVAAAHTVEFIAAKTGLRTAAATDCTGTLSVATLGLVASDFADVAMQAEWWTEHHLARGLVRRKRDSHKGSNGRVLCIGGDHGHGGAIVLAAQAALRSGAGLVDVMTRAEHIAPLLARCPEAMAYAFDGTASKHAGDGLRTLLAIANVVAVGPGLGTGDWGRELLDAALACGKPMLLDADALNLLASTARMLAADTVLTPHPGEAARLLGTTAAAVQTDRFAAAHALCERHGCVVVLKGAGTLVAAPGRTTRLIDAGNPGMAVGGMGDLLSGVIAALRGQGLDAFDAASVGALLHAVAGDRAAAEDGERGLLPGDLLPWLRRCANPGAR